jgi:hypothetical protein
MTDTKKLILERLAQIQASETASRGRAGEIVTRLGYIEHALGRLTSFGADMSARVTATTAALDRLSARVDRIEHRPELRARENGR